MRPTVAALSNGNFDSVPYGVTVDYLRLVREFHTLVIDRVASRCQW